MDDLGVPCEDMEVSINGGGNSLSTNGDLMEIIGIKIGFKWCLNSQWGYLQKDGL